MARHVQLTLALGRDARAAAVRLTIRGVAVLEAIPFELRGSALSLARAAMQGHAAGTGAPLFPAPGGAAPGADFSVALGESDVTLHGFRGTAVGADATFTVPWTAFADQVLRLGRVAVRRSAPSEQREELRALLHRIRIARRER